MPHIRELFEDDNEFFFNKMGHLPIFNAMLGLIWLKLSQTDGRRGSVEYPSRTPDLMPLDSFSWEHLKDKIHAAKPATIAEL